MNLASDNKLKLDLFKKDGKGNITLVGSGDYLRKQKAYYSAFSEPCKELYKDQVQKILKNSTLNISSLLSNP